MPSGKSCLKRRRCTKCGRFSERNHSCPNNTDNVSSTSEPLGILYSIPDSNLLVSSVDARQLQSTLEAIGLSCSPTSSIIVNKTNIRLTSVQPSKSLSIAGDGNCLFTALGVAVGLSHQSGHDLKKLIVSNMDLVTFPENSLQTSIYSAEFPNQNKLITSPTVNHYLQTSRMAEIGVFGTCVEICTFCQIFKLDVYVYHSILKSWFVYKCDCSNDRQGVFIQQTRTGDHFEVITGLTETYHTSSLRSEDFAGSSSQCGNSAMNTQCHVMQTTLAAVDETEPLRKRRRTSEYPVATCLIENRESDTAVTSFCLAEAVCGEENTTTQSRGCPPTAVEHRQHQFDRLPGGELTDEIFLELTANFVPSSKLTEESTVEIESKLAVKDTVDAANVCCKCMRQATVYFPFDIMAYSKVGLVNRKFGRKLENEVVHLCCSCYNYCTAPKVDWQMAWPAVFFTLLSDTSKPEACLVAICSLLPLEIRQHWLGVITLFPICIQGVLNRPRILGTCTVDGTRRLKRFEQLMRTMRQKEMAEALDLEPYPNIRCPFGCWTFIEDPGYIPAQHFINLIDKTFSSFQASAFKKLRGARLDFLRPLMCLETFLVAATVRLHKKEGLVVQTCSAHDRGCAVQFLHPPRHPELGRIPTLFEERLAIASPSLSCVSSLKTNYASHTYQLFRSVGSYSGMSIVSLRRKRRWNITSNRLFQAEGTAMFFRSDIPILIRQWVAQGKLIEDVATDLSQYQPKKEKMTEHVVDLDTCIRLTNVIDENEQELLSNVKFLQCYALAQPNNEHGCSPPPLINDTGDTLWFLQAACCISPILCSSMASGVNHVLAKNLLSLLRHTFTGFAKESKLQRISQAQADIDNILNNAVTDNDNPNMISNLFQAGGVVLHALCADLCHLQLSRRSELTDQFVRDVTVETKHVIATTTDVNNLRSKVNPPPNIVLFDVQFELVGCDCGSWGTDAVILLRHGGRFCNFWRILKANKFAEPLLDSPETLLDKILRGYWTFLIYRGTNSKKVSTVKWQYLSNLTGQGVFICDKHDVPLTRDFRRSNYFCRCGRSSFLRCAYSKCNSCVCKKHFDEGMKNPNLRVLVGPIAEQRPNAETAINATQCELTSNIASFCEQDKSVVEPDLSINCSSQNSNSSVASLLCNNMNANSISESELAMNNLNVCSGERPIVAVQKDTREEDYIIPLHILLNSRCNLLYRKKSHPISLTVKEKRFMENITASSTSSTPLLQPEGLLFPTIFWCQSSDGSIEGAIPISLFQSEKYNKQVGFAGLENMLRTRITDGSLLTSSHASYLQFVFDCLLNLQLSKTDIRIVLNRGWQELGSTPTNYQYYSAETFKFDCEESRKNVCEVAALIRDKNPTYFVTYTCGQSTHPGLRKIFAAIDKLYSPDMTSKELRLSVIQSELMPMLRCWHRASQYVMQWLQCSAEQPLGPISHLWMRYEWQDETSAFPLIHALVCTGENKFGPEVRSRVCCSKETFIGALSDCCPALSDSERFRLGELFQKYQRHDCGKGRNRCKKKN